MFTFTRCVAALVRASPYTLLDALDGALIVAYQRVGGRACCDDSAGVAATARAA